MDDAAVMSALEAIEEALVAIRAALRGDEPTPVTAALAEVLMSPASSEAPKNGLAAALRHLADQAAAAQRVRKRTGVDLAAWRPSGAAQ